MKWTQLGSTLAPVQLEASEIVYIPANYALKISAKIFMYGGSDLNGESNYQMYMYDFGKR